MGKTPLNKELKNGLKETGLYVNYFEDIAEYAKCEANRDSEFRHYYIFMMHAMNWHYGLYPSPHRVCHYELPALYVHWRGLKYRNKKEDN